MKKLILAVLLVITINAWADPPRFLLAVKEDKNAKSPSNGNWHVKIGDVYEYLRTMSLSEFNGGPPDTTDQSYVEVQIGDVKIESPAANFVPVTDNELLQATTKYSQEANHLLSLAPMRPPQYDTPFAQWTSKISATNGNNKNRKSVSFSAFARPQTITTGRLNLFGGTAEDPGIPFEFDGSSGAWNDTTKTFTAPWTGVYCFSALCRMPGTANVAGDNYMGTICIGPDRLFTLFQASPIIDGNDQQAAGSCLFYLNAGTVVTLQLELKTASGNGARTTFFVFEGHSL